MPYRVVPSDEAPRLSPPVEDVDRIPVTAVREYERIHFQFFTEQELQNARSGWGEIAIYARDPPLVEIPSGVTTQSRMEGKPSIGVSDGQNRFVMESGVFRGAEGWGLAAADSRSLASAHEDSRGAYYLGCGDSSYGHFLLETLCRAWAWEAHGAGRVPIIQSQVPDFACSLYALIPGLTERIESVRTPTRFHSVLVPGASFVLGRQAHLAFRELCHRMAERAMPVSLPQSERPLYLSRSGVGSHRRAIEGEEQLERLLKAEGFLIVRPEALPIVEQIALFNTHKWIVLPRGSACHTRLFSLAPANLLILTTEDPRPNFVLCDLLSEGNSYYLNVLARPDVGTPLRLWQYIEPVLLDTERVLSALKHFGLVRDSASFDGPPPDLNAYRQRWLSVARWQAERRPEVEIQQAIEDVTAALDASR